MLENNNTGSPSGRLFIIILIFGMGFACGVILGVVFYSDIAAYFGWGVTAESQTNLEDTGSGENAEAREFFKNLPLTTEFKVRNYGPAIVIPADNDSSPDMAAVVYLDDGSYRLVYVDLDAEPALRWQSEPLPDKVSNPNHPIIANLDGVYFSFEGRLLSFDRGTGEILGDETLSDQISFACESCFQVVGDWLAVLTTDGYLHGYLLPTLEPVWQIRLVSVSRRMYMVNGNPAVVDDLEGVNGGAFKIFDIETGGLLQEISPECPNEPFPDDPQIFSVSNQLLVDETGTIGYFFFGFFEPGCIQAWDLIAGEMLWGVTLPVDLVRSPEPEQMVLTADAVYYSMYDLLVGFSLGAGEMLFQQEITDYIFTPRAVIDSTLVGVAERTRGSTRYEIWGFDGQTGTKRWSLPMDAESEMYEHGTSPYEDGEWRLGIDGGQLVLLSAFSGPDRITIDLFNPLDGALVQTYPVTWDGNGLYVRELAINRGRIWLVINDRLQVMDLRDGNIEAVWP